MSKHLQRDMENVHREILSLSGMVEEMIDRASEALCERKPLLAKQVMQEDPVIDQLEVKIEEDCLKTLALHQPVAVDLRRIATVMKVNNDLERIADLAVNMAERAESLAEFPEFPIPAKLKRMVDLATMMVRGALDAFVALDVQSARRLCLLDEEVDRYNCEVIAEVTAMMQKNPANVVPGLHCFSAARHVERIADHATNIAEDVLYLVEGEIVRHRPPNAVPKSADAK